MDALRSASLALPLLLLLAAASCCTAQQVHYNPTVCVSGAEVFPRDHLCWGYVNYDFYVGYETTVQSYIESFNEIYGASFRMLFFSTPPCRDLAFKTICSLYFPKCGNATVSLVSALETASRVSGLPMVQLPSVQSGTPLVLVYQLPAMPCQSTCSSYTSQCSDDIEMITRQFPPTLGPTVVQVNCSAVGRHRVPLYPEAAVEHTVPLDLGPNYSQWSLKTTVSVQCFDAANEIKSPPALDPIQAILDLSNSVAALGKCMSPDILSDLSEERDFRHLCLSYVDYDFLAPPSPTVREIVSLIDGVADLRILLFADPVCRDAVLSFQCAFAYRKCVDTAIELPLIGKSPIQLPVPPSRSLCLEVQTACAGTIPPDQLAVLEASCYANDTSLGGLPMFPEQFFLAPLVLGHPYNVTLLAPALANAELKSDPGPLDCPLSFHYNKEQNLCTWLPLCYQEPLVFDVDYDQTIIDIRKPTIFISALFYLLLLMSFFLFRRYQKWPAWIGSFPVFSMFMISLLIMISVYHGREKLCESKYEPYGLHSWCGAQGILIFYFAHQSTLGMMLIAMKWTLYMLVFTVPFFKKLNHDYDWIGYVIALFVIPIYLPITSVVNEDWNKYNWPFHSCFTFATDRPSFYSMQIVPYMIFLVIGVALYIILASYGIWVRYSSGRKIFEKDTYRIFGLMTVVIVGTLMYTSQLMWTFEDGQRLSDDIEEYIPCLADAWSKYGYLAAQEDGGYNGSKKQADWWCQNHYPKPFSIGLMIFDVSVVPIICIGFWLTYGPVVFPLWFDLITKRTLGEAPK